MNINPDNNKEVKSAAVETGRKPFVLSVRIKGLIVFGALIGYALVIALFVFHEKGQLLRTFEQIQRTLEVDSMLKEADSAAFHAVMGVFANIDSPDRDASMQRIRMHFQSLRMRYSELKSRVPELDVSLDAVDAAMAEASRHPTKANMNRLVVELVKIKNEITNLAELSRQARERMSDQYRMQSNSVAVTALFLGMLGLALLGAITGLFFKQLTEDLRLLQQRALDIVNGYRGEPLPIRRHDEVGQLMMAVNSMAVTLDNREKELLLERQKYFHQEKMAAIGALAAGVAHEIGNPIAAISGIAQQMEERRLTECSTCSNELCRSCRPDLILEQAQRLAAITREISDFSSPQLAEPQFLDLNAQLRCTSSLIRYDKRLRGVELKLDLDPQLPAIYGVGDQITQVIMNLLINAMDALETVGDQHPCIIISSRVDDGRVCLTVEDNGPGMEKDVLERAFEAFFTTKPAGKGTGLGLSLCYSIMRNHGGSIEIDSTPGAGTRVRAYFPIKEIE
jgi:signal transduction histidine kinase